MLFPCLFTVFINCIYWIRWQFFDGKELAAQHRDLFTPGIDASLLGWSIFHERLSGIWNYAVLNQLSAWLLSLARCLQWIPIFLNWWGSKRVGKLLSCQLHSDGKTKAKEHNRPSLKVFQCRTFKQISSALVVETLDLGNSSAWPQYIKLLEDVHM